MVTRHWLVVLVAAVALDVVLSLGDVRELLQGEGGIAQGTIALVEVLSHVVIAVAVIAVSRFMITSQHRLFRFDQVMTATATTTVDWLWETDAEHRFTYASPGVQDLLGYAPESLVGMPTLDLLAADEDIDQLAGLVHIASEPAVWDHIDVAWRHRDGHPVVLRGSTAPILDKAGRVVGYRGTRRFVSNEVEAAGVVNAARRQLSVVIATRAVDVAFQPIVDLLDGHLAGVEALARFRDGRAPDTWFKDARETGQTVALDRLTFVSAVERMDEFPASAYVSVNASPDLILDAAFRADLLARSACLDRLVIEITEHDRVSDYQALNDALSPLRERGVRIAVDDAGAGYASLTHVLQLRPDIIKLDRELITELQGDRARRSLVTALVLLALDVGASVTGEGVETPEQLETLATLGVDHAQGYLVARPSTNPEVWRGWTGKPWPQAALGDALFLRDSPLG